ncbi:hypothetical protein MPLDJ20_20149 [Mesorhizobium plurifarium]|uniref:Uncharacterized protein n=1 Tax=Mesorhizobium plurifarium TaxID=69974 RepID=A0A090F162_MESPL|nr:hypothetical protein MPLDJ20_20149 [Mesorhizobium plurifarium]
MLVFRPAEEVEWVGKVGCHLSCSAHMRSAKDHVDLSGPAADLFEKLQELPVLHVHTGYFAPLLVGADACIGNDFQLTGFNVQGVETEDHLTFLSQGPEGAIASEARPRVLRRVSSGQHLASRSHRFCDFHVTDPFCQD